MALAKGPMILYHVHPGNVARALVCGDESLAKHEGNIRREEIRLGHTSHQIKEQSICYMYASQRLLGGFTIAVRWCDDEHEHKCNRSHWATQNT